MIEKLEIKNFKGVENVKLDKFGIVNSIYGKNNSGKSTILDCMMWLLCDCTLTYGETNNNDVYLNLNKPNELIEASLVVNGNKLERVYGHRLNEDNTMSYLKYGRKKVWLFTDIENFRLKHLVTPDKEKENKDEG